MQIAKNSADTLTAVEESAQPYTRLYRLQILNRELKRLRNVVKGFIYMHTEIHADIF